MDSFFVVSQRRNVYKFRRLELHSYKVHGQVISKNCFIMSRGENFSMSNFKFSGLKMFQLFLIDHFHNSAKKPI